MIRQIEARVLETEEVSPNTFVTWYAGVEVCRAAQPGQFVMVQPRAGLDPLLPRAFSFYRFREREGERQFGLLYLVIGAATALMAAQQPGDTALVTGAVGARLPGPQSRPPVAPDRRGRGDRPSRRARRSRDRAGLLHRARLRGARRRRRLPRRPPAARGRVRGRHGGRLAGAPRSRHRPVHPLPALGGPDLGLRSHADVPQHGRAGATGRTAAFRADPDGDGDGLRHGDLLRLRPSSPRRASSSAARTAPVSSCWRSSRRLGSGSTRGTVAALIIVVIK